MKLAHFILLQTFLFLADLSWAMPDSVKQIANIQTIQQSRVVPLKLEYAITPDQHDKGLMERSEMQENSGMLFIYENPRIHYFWMFNTYMDLSIAFLDDNSIIREIKEMKSYPEMMKKMNASGNKKNEKSIKQFFSKKGTSSSFLSKFALEVKKGWFNSKDIGLGDVVVWDVNHPLAYVIKTMDLSKYTQNEKPNLLILNDEGPSSVSFSEIKSPQEVVFLDSQGNIILKDTLGKTNEVLYLEKDVKYICFGHPHLSRFLLEKLRASLLP